MSTSAIITNRIVRTRSFPESPKRGTRTNPGRVAVSSLIRVSLGASLAFSQVLQSAKTAQPPYDATHLITRQTPHEICHGGAFSHLPIGRIGPDQTSKGTTNELLGDRQGPGGDQFPGRGPDNGGAEDVALAVGNNLDVAIGRLRGQGPVVLAIGRAQHADGAGFRPGARFPEGDLGG